MNKKLKTTFKNLLEDKLPSSWEDFEKLHPDKDWVIYTINELLTEKYFLKEFEVRLLSSVLRTTSMSKPANMSTSVFLTSFIETCDEDTIDKLVKKVLEKPFFLPDIPKPHAPEKWLRLAKDLVENEGLLEKFNEVYDTWNLEQVALKLRDLCKENEEEIQGIIEELKKERH